MSLVIELGVKILCISLFKEIDLAYLNGIEIRACNWWANAKVDLAETDARKIPSETYKSVNGELKAEENSNDLMWADTKNAVMHSMQVEPW